MRVACYMAKAGLGWNRMEWRLIGLVKGGRKEGRKERWGKGGEGRGGEGKDEIRLEYRVTEVQYCT